MKKTKKNFSNSTLGIFFLSSILSSFLTACSDVPSLQSKKIASGFSSTQLSQGVAFVGIFDRTNHKNNIDLNTDYSHFLLYLNQSTNTKTTITTKNKDAVKFIDNKNLENLLGQNLYQTLTQDIQEKNQAANPTLQAIQSLALNTKFKLHYLAWASIQSNTIAQGAKTSEKCVAYDLKEQCTAIDPFHYVNQFDTYRNMTLQFSIQDLSSGAIVWRGDFNKTASQTKVVSYDKLPYLAYIDTPEGSLSNIQIYGPLEKTSHFPEAPSVNQTIELIAASIPIELYGSSMEKFFNN